MVRQIHVFLVGPNGVSVSIQAFAKSPPIISPPVGVICGQLPLRCT